MTEEAQSTLAQPENPITPENVAPQNEAPPMPDASILKQRIDAVFRGEEPQPQVAPEISQLQQQIEALQQARAPQPQPKEPSAQELIKQLQEQQESLQQRQQDWIDQQEREQAAQEYASWVSAQEQHFPLTNLAGYQQVGLLKIETEKQRTGQVLDPVKAAQMVEQELVELIHKCAPQLGYVTRDNQTAGREEAPDIHPTDAALSAGLPANADDMDLDEYFQALKKAADRR